MMATAFLGCKEILKPQVASLTKKMGSQFIQLDALFPALVDKWVEEDFTTQL